MSANVDAMVREGINAYKSGQKDEARVLLLKATELDQYNEQAWLWLSGLMDTPEDQRTCLENVLAINPNNERAKQGLSYLTGQTSAGNVSPFSASAAPPPAYPSAETPPSAYSSASTSVEWSAPNDSPLPQPAWSSLTPSAEPVGAELDDWVSNLNLPVNDTLSAESMAAAGSTSPFGDFDLDDDQFGSGPFGSEPLSLDEEAAPARRSASGRRSPVPTEAPEPAPTPRRSRKERKSGSLLEDADTDRDGAYFESGEGEMFGYIPPEIPPTRLPGTDEHTPILLTISMFVLIILNLGLGVVIMLNIFT